MLFVTATEGIDPVQLEPAVTRSQIQFVAFDHGDDMGFHAVERKIEPVIFCRRKDKGERSVADPQRRGTFAVLQAYAKLATLPLSDALAAREHPLPPAHRHPASGAP